MDERERAETDATIAELSKQLPPGTRFKKLKMVRDYSRGSIVDQVAAVESVEELKQLRDEVIALDSSKGGLPNRTRRRLEKAFNARYIYLSTRLIQPLPSGRLYVPKDNRLELGGGRIILPGEETKK